MRKPLLFIALLACILDFSVANAQVKLIATVAGGSAGSSYAGDGLEAINPAVRLNRATGVCVDNAGNIYIADNGNARVRKVDAKTRIIHTIAGNGTSGFSGDNGPATAAQLNANVFGLCLDKHGNLYIADQSNNRIRKVDAVTGKITTVVGGGTSTADGVGALSASILTPNVYVDNAGNIYFTAVNKIRMVSAATGRVTTVAGTGYMGYTGDGHPATAALLNAPDAITGDAFGNIYFSDENNNVIRQIATDGNIYTVAGTGVAGHSGDGGLAVSARLTSPRALGIDANGSIYFSDGAPGPAGYIRMIDAASGIISTLAGCAGCPTVGYDTVGTPGLSESVDAYYLTTDAAGNIYYSEYSGVVKRLNNPLYSTDSFSVSVSRRCNGPEMSLYTHSYIPGRGVKTYFGDGTSDTGTVLSFPNGGGYMIINHTYQVTGTYSIQQVLFNGASPIDTLSFPYVYNTFCRTLPLKIYYDVNANCIKDQTEPYGNLPSLLAVAVNGAAADTVSATSGFYYDAYGTPGDVFSFKMLPSPGGLVSTCPLTGIISDTLVATTTPVADKFFGMSCMAPGFDLGMNTINLFSRGEHQATKVFASNRSCNPVNATLTVNFSPKYVFGFAIPAPSAVSGNSISWDLSGFADIAPVQFFYQVENSISGPLAMGDTVISNFNMTPTMGDIDKSNNAIVVVDTITSSEDPNAISVYPQCVVSGLAPNQLQYTIRFENTGTDTAFNIYVLDTLPDYIDPKSVRIVMASAVMNVSLIKSGGYNVVRFDFPNINLRDSSHHNQCEGAVIFTVNTTSGIADGINVFNEAGIYFDYNSVVMTNTAATNVGGCQPEHVAPVNTKTTAAIYPNPATDELTVKMDYGAYSDYLISNSIGQSMVQNKISAAQTTVNIKALPAGLYYITLTGDNGTKVMKFVKL